MKTFLKVLVFLLTILLVSSTFAQINYKGLSMGGSFGFTYGQTESEDQVKYMLARAYIRYHFSEYLATELGGAFAEIQGSGFKTEMSPLADGRLLFSPFVLNTFKPYIYAGYGTLYYSVQDKPTNASSKAILKDWSPFIPVGLGMQLQILPHAMLEASGGYNYTPNADLNAVRTKTETDKFWSVSLGINVFGESGDADPDNDGLTNDQEKELGTERKKADTDGDGLTDGEEVNQYKTNPLKDDSDGDGLKDSDEVKINNTDPNKADTDSDGLSDSDEINKYKTDPLKADTDVDGLTDSDEISKYKVDPLKADTDADGLNDGDEVLKYHTDPLKKDTDGGTVNDGDEIAHATNPLDPADDIPKKEEIKVEVGKAIVLEGIVFQTNKSELSLESEEILQKALNTLEQNLGIEVEIRGYTDNVGKRSKNIKLSQSRADAVKSYLVSKGIDAKRITTKGFGPENPIASNETEEGRKQNRRIEFFRTK